MTQNGQSTGSYFPALDTTVIWKRRRFIIRAGIYFSIICFLLFLIVPWKSNYEALIRIEPDLSTKGETTSLEAEMDVIQSWGTLSKAVLRLQRTVKVKPTRSGLLIHLDYYKDYIAGLFSTKPVPDYANYQPGLYLEKFVISDAENDMAYINRDFLLKRSGRNGYVLYDPAGRELVKSKVGDLETVKLDRSGNHVLQIKVRTISGLWDESFKIKPVEFENFTTRLQHVLKVDRKGFRETAGLMTVNYSNSDPVLAKQLLETVVNIYVTQAYDRSSLGKIKGLANLEAQSVVLRQQVADADKALAEFKDNNQVMDLPQDQDFNYKRSLDLNEELGKRTLEYRQASVSLTEDHPTVVALSKQIAFLKKELSQINGKLEGMPQKQREYNALKRNVDVAQTTLDQNTMLAAQLRAEVQTITGYAHVISLHSREAITKFWQGIVVIILGFLTGIMVSVTWLVFKASPDRATISDTEDLAIIVMPIVATLPFLWKGWRWLWYDKKRQDAVRTESKWKEISRQELERLESETQFLLSSDANQFLIFAGIKDHAGTAFCAREFAIASARHHKTLLIDACIMKADAHTQFGSAPTPGLSDLLIGEASIKTAVHTTNVSDLYLMPAGTKTSNFRLLSDPTLMENVLSRLASVYDRIIIEFPPLTPSLCKDGVLNVGDAVFIVADSHMPVRKFMNTLHSCGVDELKSAFFILNKK